MQAALYRVKGVTVTYAEGVTAGLCKQRDVQHLHHPASLSSSGASSCSEDGSSGWEIVSEDNNDGDDDQGEHEAGPGPDPLTAQGVVPEAEQNM